MLTVDNPYGPLRSETGARERALKAAKTQIALVLSKSLRQLVQDEIERQILSGILRAGERLNEVAIAQKLKVSRGPVREALRSLEEAGLVRFEKNRGAAVRIVDPDEAVEIYEVRAWLEALACRRLGARITAAQVRNLRELVGRMDRAAAAADVRAFHRLNIAFHESLVEYAGNGQLAAAYRRLVDNLTLFRHRSLVQAGSPADSNRDHRRIVEKLAAGEGEEAALLIHKHIEASSHRTQRALRSREAATA